MKKKLLALLAAVATCAALPALADIYVTPTGAGTQDGSSWENAYAGIQAAVDAVDAAEAANANYEIPVIRVADGTYSRVVVTNDLALDVRSVNGAAQAIIDGGGTNNCVDVRLSGYTNFGQSPKFTGFTLRNGNVRSQTYDRGGGAGGGTLVDCVIEDCQAWMGGGTYNANTMRCIIRRCSAPTYQGGIVYGGNHVNDLMYGNSGNYALVCNASLYSCTVADNAASSSNNNFLYNSTARNCILWGNTVNGEPCPQDDVSDPKFVGGGDYRLRAGSPALDDGLEDWQTEDYVGLTDLAGNARVQGAKIDRGCYEAENGEGLEGVLVLASAVGNGSVSPAHSFVNVGSSVTITADSSTWHRDVTAWKTNGVAVAGAAGNSFTFTATGEQIDVVAQFATLDWFVNGATGSDTANDGRTESTAFKTIQHAIDCAAPEEQITVAAGVYAPIDASHANVSIIGAGRDTTIIDGGGTTRCADLGERGFSYLQGFTLRNGRHMNVGTTPGQGEEGTGGGGAKGGYLIDCAIENCHSTFGGGAFHSEIHRTIIRDCSAYEGGGVIFGECFNCLLDRNWAVQGGAASSASLWGCTVVRSRAVDFAAVYVSTAYSTIFWGNKSANGRSNYSLQGHGECCFEEEMEDYNVSFTDDPLFVDPENGDFRLREDSPCIDHGWGEVLEDEFDVRGTGYPRRIDALGGEEIADMGCYEGGVTGHVVSVRVDGCGNVSQRTFVVDNGGSATITATTNGRAFQKWLVDGVEAGTSTTLTLSNIDADHVVTACFQRNTTTVTGSGEALQNAINNASDGDTLVVADGTYSAIDARGKELFIVSANGPAAAIIRGTSTTRAATLSTSMTQPATTLAGFTVEGGTSTDLIYGGGGILGGNVSNCVVRGNSAFCGGGVAMAYVTHSIISNNTASVSGGGACASWLDTCLIVHNAANVNLAGFDLSAYGGGVPSAADNESGGGGIAFSAANFCTITRNTSTTYAGGGMFVVLDNTYIAGNTASGGPAARQNADLFPQYPNHVCATSPNFIDDEGFVNSNDDDSLADPDNGDYRLKATSLCVEGGDMAFVSHRTATDLDGNPRWRGSAPDIGCYEAAAAAPVVVPDVDASTGPIEGDADEGVLVEWGVARGAEWYTVHRSETDDFATATQVGRVDAPVTEFFDATAAVGVRYRYWVVAHSSEAGDGPIGASVEGYWVAELVITTPYLPDGLTRELYSTNLTATGGMPPYTWTVETPSWLSVSGSTLSGMPRSAGSQTVRVTVEDTSGQSATRSWTLTIVKNPAPLGPATPYAGECYEGNYLIENFDQLRLFEETLRDPDGFDFDGATFTLVNDIDCGGRAFAPTNGACGYFNGTFDGQGHVISNYVNNGYSTGSLLGDAGYGAVVRDVTLVGDIRLTTLYDRWGTTAISTNNGAAAFAEYVRAGPGLDAPPGLTMVNCHFVGTITNDQTVAEGVAAGGLVAYVDKQGGFDASPVGTVNLRMTNCTVRATVNGREGVGGLVAAGYGIEATDCHATGGVYRASNIGGLGGFIRRSSFTDCTFDGEVDAIPASKPAEGGGGLVGAARGVTLRRCAARARVCWEYPTLHDDDHTFTACGGAIGVSWDDTACYDCSFEGSIQSKRGFFGGFVGWADSAEVFSNCHVRATYAPDGFSTRDATGGFAGVVSSDGARFVDCSAESLGGGTMIDSGFFASQQPVVQNVSGIPYTVGSNSFLRCSAKNISAYAAGFCSGAWNCSFKDCSVRGGSSQSAGFVNTAGQVPGDGYAYAQTSVFEDCSVSGITAQQGFVYIANSGEKDGSTNIFRRCRAGASLGLSSGTYARGFAYGLYKGTLAEDCAAYGVTLQGGATYGFAEKISIGATVRRCVAAVLPGATEDMGAGFVESLSYSAPVEDCYSVYAPKAVRTSSGYHGTEGGFVKWASVGYNSTGPAIARCFALSAPPDASDAAGDAGSFCGSVYNTSFENFVDCWRPAESNVRDVGNIGDDAGVGALTKAQFASATAATMPNYDFANIWRAPAAVGASSPYLAASTDANTNFWFLAAAFGNGRILVNGAEPAEAYPAGAVLTVSAVSDGAPFTGWVGEGFADPTAQTTTYTVRNVSAIGATFGTPIYTVDDWTNHLSRASSPSGSYVLMNDLDFTGLFETNGWQSARVGSFQGKLFGQGHTISNLCTTRGDFTSTAAPFNKVSAGAEIRDLTVVSSNVTNDQNTLSLAGLAAEVGSGVTISNCHAVVDWQGVYPEAFDNNAYNSCQYYGLVRTVSGSDIHIVDCTVRGRLAGGTEACGFAGSVSITGGEIARCAVLAEVCAITNRTGGTACGFAGSISLSGGATLRECFSAGIVDAAANAYGFADSISFGDTASTMRDCYSVAEVKAGGSNYYAYGIANSLQGDDYDSPNLVTNVWFGGTVRGGYRNYAFAGSSYTYNVDFANCKYVMPGGSQLAATVTDAINCVPPEEARARATWTGFDFDGVWSMTDGSTTPYFAWSLADGNFRLFAVQEPGATISVPETAAPGSAAAVSAASSGGAFFCGWAGAATYTNANVNPSAMLADNHRTARAVWGKAINTRADLEAVASDPTGVYGLGADIDLGGEPWTPLFQDTYTPFTGTIYGQGHVISNMTVNTDGGSYNGLFGCLGEGATIADLTLVNPVVKGGYCTGTLAGYANGATMKSCSAIGAKVEASGERAGGLVGFVENGSSFSQCYALGDVSSTSGYVGGFVGYVEDSPTFSECFACGFVTATGDNVGGFVGELYDTPSLTDCYALVDAKGGSYVGGFVGQIYYYDGAVTRCYSAGSASGSSEIGGFAGRRYRGTPTFTDCFRISDGLPDLGTDSTDLAGIESLDAAGFLDRSNFAAYHATGKWAQIDGTTQPYFAWGLVDGKMTLSGTIAGTGDGSIAGLGAYAPGTLVQISAVPSGSVFLGWTGNAPYADASAQATTVALDNFRIVTAEFGALVTTREQLAAIASELDGSYALGADIDISDDDWTPIGTSSAPFTGSLYAQGHKITGLRVAGTSDYAGLFRCVKDATLDGIHLEGVSVSGRQYTGALAGDVQGATTIRNCSAEGVVTNTYGYAGLLVGRVYGSGTTFDHCAATGTVVAASQDTGGLVGGVYYYPATFADCDAEVFVTGTSGGNKGGFVGSVRDSSASATFARCAASGDIVATNNSSNVGGFIGYANRAVSFEDCTAAGDVSGKGSTGGFAGKTESAVASYVRSTASGTVVNWSSSCAGGFVGAANGQNSRFEDCAALGPLVNSTSSQTGGFAGYTGGSGIVFANCSAAPDVRSTSSQTGGFVGYVNASNVLERCVAEGAVSGTSQTGGFVGQANGDRSQYLSCVANGSVAGTGNQAGGFVGHIGSTGLRFAECSALGGVSDSAYSYVGGFVGQVNNSNDLWRCMCAGAAVGKQYVGGFVGYQNGGNTAIRECFALGDATALNTGDAYAGGFAGDLSSTTYLSDSYCLGTVKGQQRVGGFAGRNYNSATTITRCYAAGVVDCAGTYAGAFIGYNQSAPIFTDCAVLAGGFHAIGSNTAGSSAEIANVAEYDEAGMKSAANFTTWLLVDDENGSVWSQTDGVTQPYLAWSAPNGKLIVYSSVGGSARGEIEGAGEYAPGATATVTAIPDGGFFVTWTGSTPYADPSSPTTTIALDNHRVAAVQFGKFITTADELDAVRNDLGGIYGLGADIDLLGRPWTPLGDSSRKFTGKFYGFGHEVMNLVATNNPTSGYKGLFGYADGAVLDGVTVSGTAKCNSGYYYVGGLVGRADATSIANCHATATVEGGRYVGGLVGGVNNGTSVIGCSAAGTVKATSNYAYAGGFAGGCESGTFEIRDSVSSAEVTSTASYLGGFIGYVTGSGASVISGCRADGYAGGNGSVGGFVGYVYAPMAISNCVARGDVRSSGANYGGFVGYLYNDTATIADCWCSGAVWGTGGTIGAFVGYKRSGILQNCSIYAYGAGPRPFCGSDANMAGGSLTASQIDVLTADWPKVKLHVEDATPISTAEELLAVTNNLSGIYVLTKDIDLEGATISPIGQSTAFSGEFYGKNHKIKNFVVNSTERYSGLFGQISGGRVNGVRAEGTVTGAFASSGSSTGTGGFAGLIGSQSLVDGCSFEGAVTNKTTYNAGGFVGRTEGSPVILRSCFTGRVVHEANGSADAGGFAGDHGGGYVMDCYAVADVEAGNNRYVGGFAGSSGGRITTSWCAGSVESTGNYPGAFTGYAQTGYITKSYYDSGKTDLTAVGYNAAYTGITPLATADMMASANFNGFDFMATWRIDEGETTPYLRTFIVQKTGYAAFLEEYGIPEDTDPCMVTNGVPLVVRYVYGIVPMSRTTDADGRQPMSIAFSQGMPVISFAPFKNNVDFDVNFTVLASRSLTDWSNPAVYHADPVTRSVSIDDLGTPLPPQMFFSYSVEVDGYGE